MAGILSMRTLESRRAVAPSMRTLAALMVSMMLLTTTLLALALAQSREVRPATLTRPVGHDRPIVDIGGR